MIEKVILWSLKNRGIVLFSTVITVALSVFLMLRTPLDAIPDISDTQVLIEVDWEGQDPMKLLSVPRVKNVRGISMQNKAFIYAIFEEGTDIYWARSRVLEYISGIELPEGAKVELGPPATSLGWIFMYALVDRTGKFDLASLRALNDFYLRYRLLKAKGVADVVSVGGYVKEYQIDVDPYKLRAYGIIFGEVINAVKSANLQRGGRFLEVSERYYTVRGVGYIRSVEDIKSAVLKVDPKTGASIKIGDVAFVQIGPALKEGAVDLDGNGEVVGGIVIMRDGENVLRVIGELKEIIRKIELPEGVELVITYDRSELVKEAIETTIKTLIKEILIVLVVVAIFLMNVRGSIPIILFLPTALLLPYIFIYLFKITTNIMSLAGMILSVGVMIDAGVVMVENVFKKLEERSPRSFEERFKLVYSGVSEVAPSLFFSLAIITVSFLSVFYLRGGR
jgi:Cu(I)/Ag(I) efflux system membrane protein CusA/SilA